MFLNWESMQRIQGGLWIFLKLRENFWVYMYVKYSVKDGLELPSLFQKYTDPEK